MRFFFIHNYKTLGTTILSQLPPLYRAFFFGQATLAEFEAKNRIRLNRTPEFAAKWATSRVSIDHLHLDTLFDLGLLGPRNVQNMQCMMVVRDPIDRFISICNYENVPPGRMIANITCGKDNGRHQHLFATSSQHDWKIVCIKMTNSDAIVQFFRQFNVHIDLSVRMNVSQKKFKRSRLTKAQIDFLTQFYEVDYALFKNAL